MKLVHVWNLSKVTLKGQMIWAKLSGKINV